MLNVVTWKWARKGYRSTFTAAHVNALARMVGRHYARPHRVLCVTNDAYGIDPAITIIPDDEDFASVLSPHGSTHPSSYRRLRMWRHDAARWFGERFVSIDLDVVAVGDLAPLWDRTEDVVLYDDPLYPGRQYCGAMQLIAAGARPQVWDDFDPLKSPSVARRAGKRGSDQAWLSYKIPGEATWGPQDGVYSYRKHLVGGLLPDDARMTIWHGNRDPWHKPQLPWVTAALGYASGRN